jgi:NADH-quinone oxidoreductase subunit C
MVNMDSKAIYEKLKAKFGDEVIISYNELKADPFIIIKPSAIEEVCGYLLEDEALAFDTLMSISGVDYPKDEKLASVYHLFSYKHLHKLVLKVELPRSEPRVPSVEKVWPAANWHERETYDLLGIIYEGHSDFRRILLPDDWVGHPLRKDYKDMEYYHGMKVPY